MVKSQSVNDGRLENGDNIESNKYKLKGGEVLISKLNPRKKTVVLTEKKKQDIVCSTEFVPFYPKKIMGKYLYYILSNSKLADYYNSFVKSATNSHQRVEPAIISKTKIPVPPLDEQRLIADFLDYKTSQIDVIIKGKERLIELLQEQRQAIITEAVTKGLSPETTKMKDSGIEWLGEVPEHWEIKKIKYLFKQIDERNNSEDAELLSLYTDIGVKPRKELEQKGNKAQTVIDYKIVKKNDIVVNKLLAWMGAISISDYEGVCSPDYDVYRKIDEEIEPRFYHYYFRSHYFKGDCYRFGKGIMMMRWRIYPEQFKSIFVVKPPYDEQVQIVNYVERIYTEYENLIEAINNQIKKLHEFRESLIYEAVTGKIDVRGFRKGE
ncbi:MULTISPECIES: restriction endonuclease subunit S [Geobacillus]|uniref:restriction endonuclease subunit S n=2 Tax=Anoxybacillaceae TaxID=3120669 RepID=UPI001364D668|nr:restriction endonuclease subunit S [Geobacillus stearothermophilus]